jgi:uncharacterized membrane protein
MQPFMRVPVALRTATMRMGEHSILADFDSKSSNCIEDEVPLEGGDSMVTQLQETGEKLNINAESLAKGLGWFSIGLGVAEVLAPKMVAHAVGLEGKHTLLIRLFGLREIASGVAIFSQGKNPAESVWGRVAGDALDIAALGVNVLNPNANKVLLGFAAANVVGVTAVDIMTATQLSKEKGQITEDGAVRAEHSIFINKTPQECYEFWKDFERLPEFMRHLVSVESKGGGITHWVAKGPGGAKIAWDAEVTNDRPNQLIAWHSLPGFTIHNRGSVRFERATGNRGTILRVEIEYMPPAGLVGAGIAKLFREEPKQQLKDDLRRFKQVIETGEVMRSDASPEGNGNIKQRQAQPLRA